MEGYTRGVPEGRKTKEKEEEEAIRTSDVQMGIETNEEISESQSERMALTPSTGGINNSLGCHKKHIKC